MPGIIFWQTRRCALAHGHQGDLLNDTLWTLAMFLVRYVWRRLELIGFVDPTGEGFYFTSGSCVHPGCITGIEIANNQITLVKWAVRSREDRSLFVAREILEGSVCLSDYGNRSSVVKDI